MVASVLIVDDERDLTTMLVYNLERDGYHASSCGDLASGWKLARNLPSPRVALIDVTLPDGSGLELCRRLRADELTRLMPVIMLSAHSSEQDRERGLAAGADDYVVKPFSMRELLLRIRAVLRRNDRSEPSRAILESGALRVDPERFEVSVAGVALKLTAMEFRLLHTLFERRGLLQTREALLGDVWGIRARIATRTVDTHVTRLREKLGPAGELIETVRGFGYRFRADPPGA